MNMKLKPYNKSFTVQNRQQWTRKTFQNCAVTFSVLRNIFTANAKNNCTQDSCAYCPTREFKVNSTPLIHSLPIVPQMYSVLQPVYFKYFSSCCQIL